MPHDSNDLTPSPVDLDFRPASYSGFDHPVAAILNGISGQRRREMVRDMLTAEGERRRCYDQVLGSVEHEILEEKATEDFQRTLSGLAGPTWMGGEYLPPRLPGEREIARVVLRSSTMDVFSLRVRIDDDDLDYHFRMVDEYQSDFFPQPPTSPNPLSLGEVIRMLETMDSTGLEMDGAGIVVAWWNQQWEFGDSPEQCTEFAWVESDHYPGLAPWYAARAAAWRAMRHAEDPDRQPR